MGWTTLQSSSEIAWELTARQHGVVSRQQLLALGYSSAAIEHRMATGRLFPLHRGVYAVGRAQLSQEGRWMGAVLACGRSAALYGQSAAELWGIRARLGKPVELCVPSSCNRRPSGLLVHRLALREEDVTTRDGIAVTAIARTIISLAGRLPLAELERCINEADRLGLITPDGLRAEIEQQRCVPGVRVLREALDRRTFSLTRSELERIFLPIAERAGLPKPSTNVMRNGFEVDFLWPDLRLVVETDGLRYHRTPAQQARDRLRDHAHLLAGDTSIRFTHEQVRYDPAYVERRLRELAARLMAPRD